MIEASVYGSTEDQNWVGGWVSRGKEEAISVFLPLMMRRYIFLFLIKIEVWVTWCLDLQMVGWGWTDWEEEEEETNQTYGSSSDLRDGCVVIEKEEPKVLLGEMIR